MDHHLHPEITLYCIPFAGGSAQTYNRFRKYLRPLIDIVPLDPSGHGRRLEEPLISSYTGMADELAAYLAPLLPRDEAPYAFFGHSMGATLAYLIIKKFEELQIRPPRRLFVSGSASPEVSPSFRGMYKLRDDAFIQAVSRLGGMPESIASEPSILELFLPVLRSDFKAASDFRWTPPDTRLAVPITALLGDRDVITLNMSPGWHQAAALKIEEFTFSGGHFFFMNHIEEIAKIINKSLKPLNFLAG